MPTRGWSPSAPSRRRHAGSAGAGRYASASAPPASVTMRCGRQQPGGQALAADRLRHGHDERGGAAVEPAIARVGPYRLRDVAGAHDRPPSRQARGHHREPVLLAAVHVDDVARRDGRAQLSHVRDVGGRAQTAGEPERHDVADALAARAVCHRLLGAAAAAERHRVAATLQLARHARRPVGVGGPAATRDELQQFHRRSPRRDSRSRRRSRSR